MCIHTHFPIVVYSQLHGGLLTFGKWFYRALGRAGEGWTWRMAC